MNTQTEPILAGQAVPKRYQCRHIHADGRRCGSPSLKREPFCYYHHTTRKPIPRADLNARYAEQSHTAPFDLPLPEDRAAIQLAIGEVLRRIAANQLDPKRAGLILYGLQIASLNLPPHPRPQAEEPAQTQQTIEEITHDETYGPLAPEAELNAPQGPKTLEQILHEQWEKDKEEWLARDATPSPQPTWTDQGQDGYGDQPIPNIQAVAEGGPMITQDAVEGLSWGQSRPNTHTAQPTPKLTKQAPARSYPTLIPPILVTPCVGLSPVVTPSPLSARQYPLCLRRNHARPSLCPPSGNRTQPHGSHGRTTRKTGPANFSPSPGSTLKSFAISPA